MQTGIAGLQAQAADTLEAALPRVEIVTPLLPRTATWMGLRREDRTAFYGYAVAERIESGRQANGILAFGYLLGTTRHFLGPAWQPERALVTDACLAGRAEIEVLLGCEIFLGAWAGLVFPAYHRDAANPTRFDPAAAHAGEDDPIGADLAACVVHLIELGLDEARPTIDGIAGRLGLSRRTL